MSNVKVKDRNKSKVEFDNAYYKIHDDSVRLIEMHFGANEKQRIHNCYKSWRNAVVKDCNCYKKTIDSMDNLYNELFPKHEQYKKQTRQEIINQVFKDYYEDDCNITRY